MRLRTLSILLLAILTSCSPPPKKRSLPRDPSLTTAQKRIIAHKIWKNESGGTVDGLTQWNKGEEFPSLGIGHFIWYPANYKGPFVESFPHFIKFARQRGYQPPVIALQRYSPWKSRQQFLRDFNRVEVLGLRQWLANNTSVQAGFIIAKSRNALDKVLLATPPTDRSRLFNNYQKVASTANGTYALIDYVNFKGEGTSPNEIYQGQGWGLRWVLKEMRNVPAGQAASREFAAAAKRCLDRRIKNSPPKRGEARWRAGWHNRCDTYTRPL